MLPTTTKEASPEIGAATEIESSNSNGSSAAGQTERITDAVGAEVPVVVHASRYSSAGLGAGKNLPPVHEETRTVIVFPNGAVVRVTASMAAGELVVLTNQQTGADVICRVVNVKTQPGIQNYVNLEFTQRAPGFWDANSSAASQKNAPKNEPTYTKSRLEETQPVPSTVVSEPVAVVKTETKSLIPQPAAPKSAPAMATAKLATDSSPAPFIVPKTEKSSSTVLSGSLLGGDAGLSEKTIGAKTGASMDDAQFKNWAFQSHGEVKTTGEASGSKKILMIAGSAILLLGAGVGGGFWLRSVRPAGTPSLAVSNSPEQSVPLPPVTTDQNAGLPTPDLTADSSSLQPAVVNSNAKSSIPAVQPAAEPAAASVQPTDARTLDSRTKGTTASSARPSAQPRQDASDAAERYPNIAVDKLSAPVARAPQAQASVEAPIMSGQIGGLAGSNSLGAGITGDAPRISAPVTPTRTGGQMQPAKSISSPAPTYPTAALDKRVEGVVTIDAELDNTGRVVSMKVISGPPELQVAALNALRKWKYQPAMLNGLAVESHTSVSMGFRLPSSKASAFK